MKRIVLLVICILLTGCRYYDYGVDTEKVTLEYPSYYFHDRGKKIDFYTVLYSDQKEFEEGIVNYGGLTIRTNHIQKALSGSYRGQWESNVTIISRENVKILGDTIKLIHKDGNGNAIVALETIEDIDQCDREKYPNCAYRKIYGTQDLPKVIQEHIYLEVIVDGRRVIIEKTYPIELKYHYSHWDIMMGV